MDVSQTPTVKVSYRLIQRDFYDALIARRNRRSTAAAPYFLIGIAVVMLILGLVTYFTGNNPQVVRSVVIPLSRILFWGTSFWGLPWWAARKQFSGQPFAGGIRTATFHNSGIHWNWDGGNGDVVWL